MAAEEDSEQPRRKRQRTAMACRACRAKKSKCDGVQPICGPCKEAGRRCDFPVESGPVGPGKVAIDASYLGDLEAMARLYQLHTGNRSINEDLSHSERDERRSSRPLPFEQASGRAETGTQHRNASPESQHQEHHYDVDFFPNVDFMEGDGQMLDALPDLISPANSGLSTSAVSTDLQPPLFSTSGPSRNPHRLESSPSGPTRPSTHRSTLISTARFDPYPSQTISIQHTASEGRDLTQSVCDEDREMDGMGVFPTVIPGNGPSSTHRPHQKETVSNLTGILSDYEHYGETSGIRFHSVLLEALLPGYQCLIGCEDPSGQKRGSGFPRFGFLGLPLAADDPSAAYPVTGKDLPSLSTARNMWEVFSTQIHCLYPFIGMDMLSRSYSSVLKTVDQWINKVAAGTASDADSPLREPLHQPLLALHFCVFALVNAIRPGEFSAGAEKYHMLALKLLRNHQDWPHSTIKVQALLHGVLLLQSVDCPGHSWNLLGYAVRSAYAIGLHRAASLRNLPALDREIRCRAWWGCIVFDRLIGVTIGRPPAITVFEPDFPMAEPLRGEQTLSILFFRESANLYTRLSSLITDPPFIQPHSETSLESLEKAEKAIADLELEYAKWRDAIVPELQTDADEDGFIQPLGLALALKGATMRLLLHRPLLLTHIRDAITPNNGLSWSSDEGLSKHQLPLARRKQQNAVGMSLAAIIETAITTVKLLQAGGCGPRALSVPWYQLFYAMNAFMSLIATFLVDTSKWSNFVQASAAKSLSALQSVHAIVRQIHATHARPSSKRALDLIEKVLGTLGLLSDGVFDQRGSSGNLSHPATEGVDQISMFAKDSIRDMGSVPPYSTLPQVDFKELYKLLDLDMGERPTDMPTADWLGMFGASG